MSTTYFFDFPRYQIIADREPEPLNSYSENREVLVLCKDHDLTDSNRALLNKILEAIGYDEKSAHIIGINDSKSIDIARIVRKLEPGTLISFEINLNKNGFNIHQSLYQSLYLEGMSILISESLGKLAENIEAKRKLWAALQSHFSLSKNNLQLVNKGVTK